MEKEDVQSGTRSELTTYIPFYFGKKYFALNSKGYCTLLLTRPMASPTGRKYGNSYR